MQINRNFLSVCPFFLLNFISRTIAWKRLPKFLSWWNYLSITSAKVEVFAANIHKIRFCTLFSWSRLFCLNVSHGSLVVIQWDNKMWLMMIFSTWLMSLWSLFMDYQNNFIIIISTKINYINNLSMNSKHQFIAHS